MRRWGAAALVVLVAACGGSVTGDGDVVVRSRTVEPFETVSANNGVGVRITIDPSVSGPVVLEVTTDANLQELLHTEVRASALSVTVNGDRPRPSGPFDVAAVVARLTEISADNGAEVEVTGSVAAVMLSANNGANVHGLEVVTVEVDADNGASVAVCVTGAVTGTVTNGASLTVLCGGDSGGVETSDGGSVSQAP